MTVQISGFDSLLYNCDRKPKNVGTGTTFLLFMSCHGFRIITDINPHCETPPTPNY